MYFIGCAILVRAMRLGVHVNLCSQGESSSGVCLIDACDKSRLGGGHLQDYMINSNTFGRYFVSNVIENKKTLVPPEDISGTPLEKLKESSIGSTLESKGNYPAPLIDVGKYLCEVRS